MTPTADLSASLLSRFTQLSARPSADHAAFNVSPADAFAVLNALRDESGYDMLVDVTAVDWGAEATPRFTVLWHLFSTKEHNYLRIAADLAPAASDDANAEDLSDAAMPFAPSVVALWPSADWHERETYDLFGIRFLNHPDLRRILMWDGYPYHPLRKDFPLAGIDTPLPDLEVADITHATVKPAPMMGGPFVASTGKMNLTEAEPRAKDESWTERREKPETD